MRGRLLADRLTFSLCNVFCVGLSARFYDRSGRPLDDVATVRRQVRNEGLVRKLPFSNAMDCGLWNKYLCGFEAADSRMRFLTGRKIRHFSLEFPTVGFVTQRSKRLDKSQNLEKSKKSKK